MWLCKKISVCMAQNLNLRSVSAVCVFQIRTIPPSWAYYMWVCSNIYRKKNTPTFFKWNFHMSFYCTCTWGLYALFLKGQGHHGIFPSSKGKLWGNCKFLLRHFKGNKAIPGGMETIASVASVKYQAWYIVYDFTGLKPKVYFACDTKFKPQSFCDVELSSPRVASPTNIPYATQTRFCDSSDFVHDVNTKDTTD